MDPRPLSLSSYWRLIRGNRNFRLLWMAQIVSEVGDWLYAVAIYSLLLELTGTAKSVATAVVLQVLPQVFIAPMAGVINDCVSRRKVMIMADLVRACIVLCMPFVARVEFVPALYSLLFLETVMWAFFEPGRTAMIPSVTKNESDTVVANALSSTTWSFNLAFGSTVGGAIAVLFGRTSVFCINAATFLLSAAILRSIRLEETHLTNVEPFRLRNLFDFSPIFEGLRYVRSNTRLLATLFVKAGLGFMGAHWVILPILGERTFPVGMDELGAQRAGMLGMSLLLGARGVGALIGPLVGGYFAGRDPKRLRRGILCGFLSIAAGYLALTFAPSIWAAAACVVVAHAGGSIIWVFSTTLLHFQTDDRFRGRVFSVDFSFLTLSMSIVIYTGGILVDSGMSVRALAFGTGLLAFVPAALWLYGQRLWREAPEIREKKGAA